MRRMIVLISLLALLALAAAVASASSLSQSRAVIEPRPVSPVAVLLGIAAALLVLALVAAGVVILYLVRRQKRERSGPPAVRSARGWQSGPNAYWRRDRPAHPLERSLDPNQVMLAYIASQIIQNRVAPGAEAQAPRDDEWRW